MHKQHATDDGRAFALLPKRLYREDLLQRSAFTEMYEIDNCFKFSDCCPSRQLPLVESEPRYQYE